MSEAGPSIPPPNPASTLMPSSTTSNITSPNSIPASTTTLIESIQSLLSSHSSRNLSLTHLHPYSPSSSVTIASNYNSTLKGKGKSNENHIVSDLNRIKQLRDNIGRLKNVLNSGSSNNEEEGKLIRGLKEVSNHQISLLSQSQSINRPINPCFSMDNSSFPSKLLLLTPVKLLENISQELGLQCFIEDSQFGLLKSSLAIAGKNFVIDVDLEIDTLLEGEGEGEDDVDMNHNNHIIPNQGSNSSSFNIIDENTRGKTKLTKITINHVKSNGETAKSIYIENVLKQLIESYLDIYNDNVNNQDKIWEKQKRLDQLILGLGELKVLDDYSTSNSGDSTVHTKDGFEEIELLSKELEKLLEASSQCKIYFTKSKSIFPTFHLLPLSSTTSSYPPPINPYNPVIKIRPATLGESIPSPFNHLQGTIDGDVNMEDTKVTPTLNWLDNWIIEVEPDLQDGIDGLTVRRNWLNPQKVESDNQNGIKVENLLYRPLPPPPIPSTSQQAQLFPYTSTFSHSIAFSSSASSDKSIGQRWSMVQPGPNAFVIRRIGIPRNTEDLSRLLDLLRDQIILNKLFKSIFVHLNMLPDLPLGIDAEEDDEEEDGDIDDLLSGDQKSIPINLQLTQYSININFPLIRKENGNLDDVRLVIKSTRNENDGYVGIQIQINEEEFEDFTSEIKDKMNLVDIVDTVTTTIR
ncbi:uncharacterized protein L201_005428 [Kwoniella dendrophila CBS 6074]|uniref:Mediator complex subunit 1 n=1 Tax=Kwoniella dendrophila CBS 6074 TaxID=1295534 RepID=A0AAX4K0Q5_9TREE